MIMWIRNLVRRRSVHPGVPAVQPESLHQAMEQADRAEVALRWVEAQDQEVDARSAKAAQIRRQNNLGPAFMNVMRGKRDAGSA